MVKLPFPMNILATAGAIVAVRAIFTGIKSVEMNTPEMVKVENESVIPLSVLRNHNITEGKKINITITKYLNTKFYFKMGIQFLFEGIKCLLK